MKKLFLALGILAPYCIVAQININSVNYNTVSLNETNVLQAVVFNGGSNTNVTAHVTCKNSGGETLLEAISKPFMLVQGINTIAGVSIGFSRFSYGSSSQGIYLKSNGLLPSGNYTYCLRINPAANGEDGDIYCEEFASANDDFLSLVTPYDEDTLDTKWPTLVWTHSEPFNVLAKNEYYKIIVTEIKKDQTAEQAIVSNPCMFFKNFLGSHSVPYPQDAKMLEDGKTYAWQVQKISNNIIVNKTDVWQFVYPLAKKPLDIKYAVLKKDYDAAYYISYNEKIFFQFEEAYTGTSLQFHIYDHGRKKVEAAVNNEKNDEPKQVNIKANGNNCYELDLSPLNLPAGYYFLEVYNEKNRKSVLKFYIEP